MSAVLPDPFNDSISFRAGQQHERRRIGELIRARATMLCDMPSPTPRRAVLELLRLAELIDEAA